MRRRRRHSAPPTCRSCGHRVRFARDARDPARWLILNGRSLSGRDAPPGAVVIWNGLAWDSLDLEAELAGRARQPVDSDPHEEVLAQDHWTQHACAVAATIAARRSWLD